MDEQDEPLDLDALEKVKRQAACSHKCWTVVDSDDGDLDLCRDCDYSEPYASSSALDATEASEGEYGWEPES